jgi:hypothetical protein
VPHARSEIDAIAVHRLGLNDLCRLTEAFQQI